MMKLCIFLLVLLFSFSSLVRNEEEMVYTDPESMKDWVNPHQMVDDEDNIPYQPYPTKTTLENTQGSSAINQEEDKNSKDVAETLHGTKSEPQIVQRHSTKIVQSCDHPHLKHIVRVLLEATSDLNPYTEIKLPPENRETLNKFLNDKANVHDTTDIVLNSISNKTFTDMLKESFFDSMKEHFGVVNLVLFMLLLLMTTGVIVFERTTALSVRQQFIYLVVIAFVVSIPWEWFRLYKIEFASKQSMMMDNLAKHCHMNHELGFAESVHLWWLSSFTFQDSSCQKYQESLLVDPLLEIPPSKAFAVTVTRFIVEPLQHIADATGKSFRALCQHLPWQWQPVMFLGCLVIVIFILILLSGIRISTPLFQIGLGVDPAIANASLQRVENQLQQLTAQQNAHPPAIENVADDNNRHVIEELLHSVQAMNDRSQEHGGKLREIKDFLVRLKPVADQARQAEAIEHGDGWEVVRAGANPIEEERQPVERESSAYHLNAHLQANN